MTVADALMLALGVIAVGSGALVVTSTHLVRAGFYLVVSLGAIAGLYLVLGAEFVAWVQILVYVGAVVVLLLFAVMLTRAPIGASKDLDRPAGPAAVIGAGVGFGLTALLVDAFRWTLFEPPPPGTGRRVGEQIFGAWVLPFEVLSILLLAALVGAIVLSRPDIGARRGAVEVAPVEEEAPDESAEVVARLERIAARQAEARARVRKQAAEERAAAEGGLVTEAPPGPADPLKDRARDVIFGASERRPAVGQPPEIPADQPRVIEGTSRDRPATPPGRAERPGRELGAREPGGRELSGPQPGAPEPGRELGAREPGGRELEGRGEGKPLPGRAPQRELPPSPADGDRGKDDE